MAGMRKITISYIIKAIRIKDRKQRKHFNLELIETYIRFKQCPENICEKAKIGRFAGFYPPN